MVWPEAFAEQLEDLIVGRVLHRGDLLQHDLALQGEVLLPEQGASHEVREDVDRRGKILVQDVSLVVGMIATGVGVEGAAPYLQFERQLPRAAPLGTLEHHVF